MAILAGIEANRRSVQELNVRLGLKGKEPVGISGGVKSSGMKASGYIYEGEGGQPGLLVEPKIGGPSERLTQPVSNVRGGNIFAAIQTGGGME